MLGTVDIQPQLSKSTNFGLGKGMHQGRTNYDDASTGSFNSMQSELPSSMAWPTSNPSQASQRLSENSFTESAPSGSHSVKLESPTVPTEGLISANPDISSMVSYPSFLPDRPGFLSTSANSMFGASPMSNAFMRNENALQHSMYPQQIHGQMIRPHHPYPMDPYNAHPMGPFSMHSPFPEKREEYGVLAHEKLIEPHDTME